MVEWPAFLDVDLMPMTAAQAAYPNSPLIQRLRELSLLDGALPHSRFVAIVSEFVDFSEALSISELVDGLLSASPSDQPNRSTSDHIADPDQGEGEVSTRVKQYYLQSRGEMMTFIAQSFMTDDCPVALTLPLPSDADFSHDDHGLSVYQRFYSLHQSQMESAILKQLSYIRQAVSASSPNLSQLVALESKLSTILMSYTRKALSHIPLLLAKRFQLLCLQPLNANLPRTATTETGLPTFLLEMQSLLLAELDMRLQPTLGLVEALVFEEEENKK